MHGFTCLAFQHSGILSHTWINLIWHDMASSWEEGRGKHQEERVKDDDDDLLRNCACNKVDRH